MWDLIHLPEFFFHLSVGVISLCANYSLCQLCNQENSEVSTSLHFRGFPHNSAVLATWSSFFLNTLRILPSVTPLDAHRNSFSLLTLQEHFSHMFRRDHGLQLFYSLHMGSCLYAPLLTARSIYLQPFGPVLLN